jgi:cell division protein FtsN
MLRWLAVFAVVLNIIYFAANYSIDSPVATPSSDVAQPSPASTLSMLSERQSEVVEQVAVEQKNNTEKTLDKKPLENLPQAPDEIAPSESPDEKNGGAQTPVDEVTQSTAASEAVAPVAVLEDVAPTPTAAVTAESCWEVGKFAGEDQAKQAQQRLVALGHTLQLQKRSVQGEPDYWVFLGPYDNRRQALAAHRDLQARKIDSFLINEGELENAVSLGLFSLESGAQKMQQQRKKQGLDAQMRAVPRLRNEWWGVMRHPEVQLPDAVREKILLDQPDPPLEIKTLACESIANMQKLD